MLKVNSKHSAEVSVIGKFVSELLNTRSIQDRGRLAVERNVRIFLKMVNYSMRIRVITVINFILLFKNFMVISFNSYNIGALESNILSHSIKSRFPLN